MSLPVFEVRRSFAYMYHQTNAGSRTVDNGAQGPESSEGAQKLGNRNNNMRGGEEEERKRLRAKRAKVGGLSEARASA